MQAHLRKKDSYFGIVRSDDAKIQGFSSCAAVNCSLCHFFQEELETVISRIWDYLLFARARVEKGADLQVWSENQRPYSPTINAED